MTEKLKNEGGNIEYCGLKVEYLQCSSLTFIKMDLFLSFRSFDFRKSVCIRFKKLNLCVLKS